MLKKLILFGFSFGPDKVNKVFDFFDLLVTKLNEGISEITEEREKINDKISSLKREDIYLKDKIEHAEKVKENIKEIYY